jgi:hypothetical protein
MSRRLFILLAVLALAAAALSPVAAGAADTPDSSELAVPSSVTADIKNANEGVFIVQMADDPAVTLEAKGNKKPNPNTGAIKKYRDKLAKSQDAAIASVGAEKVYNYTVAFNGFAAVMTGADAAELAARDDVLSVWKDEIRQPATDNSPEFLELTDPTSGLWASEGLLGEDVVVGVIDTGIWPEHPSFSDQVGLSDAPGNSGKRNLAYGPAPSDWFGSCQSGEQFSQDDCNNKLIGAKYFKDGFTNNSIKIIGDYLSARDADGHGTHTASTAGGNAGVDASIFDVDRGTVSGIAPRARIAMYKACWADAGCANSDLTKAIDEAVADGVDVINYSIGSDSIGFGSDSVAFLFAEAAGVHVATSAGNAGPGAATVGSPAWVPWVTTVGASTQDRTFQGTATLGNGAAYDGASITASVGPESLIDSVDAGDELCHPGALDPAVVSGYIVLCKRGEIARVAKSQAVQLAGGVGMILYNASNSDTEVADNHYVPTVHINRTDGDAIKAYIGSEGSAATATVTGGVWTPIPAPWMASFSSRGPNGGAADIIKPDVTAPGVNILAGNTPTPFLGSPGELFQAISGTSMSSPHVAGLFALLAESHPDWSPSAAKSALMTTAYQDVKKEDGIAPADPFDMGAGHVQPNSANDPGLVYEAGLFEYAGFTCGAGIPVFDQASCDFLDGLGIPFDSSDLNYPSIGIGALAGSQAITRTVTNVGPTGTYNVSVEAPAGVDVTVAPVSLTLGTGETADFTVEFEVTSAATVDAWAFGSLTWTHGPHAVRSPIAVKPVALAAPGQVTGTGTSGSLEFDVTFGFGGAYEALPQGLVPAQADEGNVVDDPANDINVALGTGVGITLHTVEIGSGEKHARFSLFDDYTDGDDDLDLYVFDPSFGFAGSSGSGTSEEEVNVTNPVPGTWTVIVHGWQTDGPDSNYTLFSWAFGADVGNMAVTGPATAVLGAVEPIDVVWGTTPNELDPDMMYLGGISFTDTANEVGFTFVKIDS